MHDLGSNRKSTEPGGLEIRHVVLRQRRDLLSIARSDVLDVPRAAILLDEDGGGLAVSATQGGEKPHALRTGDVEEAAAFLGDSLSDAPTDVHFCAELGLFPLLLEAGLAERLQAAMPSMGRFVMHPVSSRLLSAVADYIAQDQVGMEQVLDLGLTVAGNNVLRLFIHLSGAAHSAQDVISYFKSHKRSAGTEGIAENPLDMVFAEIPEGQELFSIMMTNRNNYEVRPSEVGLSYFPVFNKYKRLSPPLATKLALCETCLKFELALGYAVVIQPPKGEEEHEEHQP